MKLRTEIKITPADSMIDHTTPIFAMGSCFANHMGGLLSNHKFSVVQNPFGIVYNPKSLVKQCVNLYHDNPINKNGFIQNGGQWVHYDYHSDLRADHQEGWIDQYRDLNRRTRPFIQKAKTVIITLGTSIVYRLNGGEIVANCHKQEKGLFTKEMLGIEETYQEILTLLRELNHVDHFILSVSPIRHTKEGLTNNMRSKMRLLEACNRLAADYSRVDYFPAFEIMMDDLRDYRFYESDLIHPSSVAIDYIWQRFGERYFTTKTLELNAQLVKVNQAYKHRPFNPKSEDFRDFCKGQLDLIESIESMHGAIDFSKEVTHFEAYL